MIPHTKKILLTLGLLAASPAMAASLCGNLSYSELPEYGWNQYGWIVTSKCKGNYCASSALLRLSQQAERDAESSLRAARSSSAYVEAIGQFDDKGVFNTDEIRSYNPETSCLAERPKKHKTRTKR